MTNDSSLYPSIVPPRNAQMPSYASFFENWLSRQEAIVQQIQTLLSQIDGFSIDEECKAMISRVLFHYQELYQEKSRAANEDVFLQFSAPWLTSFERSLMWICGFKPTILFPLLENSLVNGSEEQLSEIQKQRIEMVKAETQRKEREVTQAMARVQETVAEQPVYGLARKFGTFVDGMGLEFDVAMEGLKTVMLVVVSNSDTLREVTAAKVLEILTPVQGVKFLMAVALFQLQTRKWGMQKDLERKAST